MLRLVKCAIALAVVLILCGNARAATFYVDPTGKAGKHAAYTTIQTAVNAAKPGDTIIVSAATYTEDVAISTDSLTLKGAQAGANPTQGRAGPESVVNGSFTVNSTGVTLTGFTVSTAANWCILVSGRCLVENCILYGLTPEITYAVWTFGDSNIVSNNYIQAGVVYLYSAPNSLVSKNRMVAPPTWTYTGGIDFYYSSNCTAKGNEIDNCSYVFGIRHSQNLLIANNFGAGNVQLYVTGGDYNLPDASDTVRKNNFTP